MNAIQQIRDIITVRQTAEFYRAFAQKFHTDKGLADACIEIILLNESKYSFYASWFLCHAHDKDPYIIKPYMKTLIESLGKHIHIGTDRSILRCISRSPISWINEELEDKLLGECLNHMESLSSPTALKMLSMVILEKYFTKYPDLIQEICSIIQLEMENGTATKGYIARAQKILDKWSNQ